MTKSTLNENAVISSTRNWVENLVIKFNLCPFAKRELATDRLHLVVSDATTAVELLNDLQTQLLLLTSNDYIETTLLIHPRVFQDFYDYNQFLDMCDVLLVDSDLDGVFQVASFHPDYQFAGTEPDDAENFTNKSPYPMLHLLREDSLEKAIASYGDTNRIHQNNTVLLSSMGTAQLQALLNACYQD